MPRNERKKAQDLFIESNSFFTEKTSFAKAYPQIEDIVIEVEESGKGVDSWNRKRTYTKPYLPGEYVNCSNTLCYGGGFSIGRPLYEMISESKTESEGTAICKGNMGSPKGKRIYRSCGNFFRFKITVKYKEPVTS
jgi:hypothetical protein